MKIKTLQTEEMDLSSSEVTVIIPRMFIGDKKKVRFKIEIGELDG